MSQDYTEDFSSLHYNDALGNSNSAVAAALRALKTLHAGPAEPPIANGREAYILWLDTSLNQLKIRNSTDDGWAVIFDWDGTTSSPVFESSVIYNLAL